MMRLAIALAAAFLTLAACQEAAQIHVSDGFVRLPAVKGRPAAAYFTLHGGATDATLISVGSNVAIKAAMHETMTAGSMSSMKPIGDLPLPAESELKFVPGGRHVMLYDLNPGIKPGTGVPLTFTFTNGERVTYNALVIAAGDPAPAN